MMNGLNQGKMRGIRFLLLTTVLMLPLAGCQTTARGTHAAKIDAALEQAASSAEASGDTTQSLELLEQMYTRDSASPEKALRYAAALREAGRLNRAAMVLAPLAESDSNENAPICAEFAALQAAMGDYAGAETHARRAVEMAPEDGKGYHILGIALDAQGHNKQAEIAFRKALDVWQGDPVPVLNNLGLNLASQGFIDEALDTLRKAAALAPGRTEIERNIRIVSALQSMPPRHGTRLVPMPPRRKPAHDEQAPT